MLLWMVLKLNPNAEIDPKMLQVSDEHALEGLTLVGNNHTLY